MQVKAFADVLQNNNIDFFTGVPDSLLKHFCAYIKDKLPANKNIIAANEGGAIGLAAGYHLATNRIALVYMQNSGIGNCVNPLLSLTDKEVYNIPVLLLIGWRGEPGTKDEPQHIKQGKCTLGLLDSMQIKYDILSSDAMQAESQVKKAVDYMRANNEVYALIVRKNTFDDYAVKQEPVQLTMTREEAIGMIAEKLKGWAFVSSTGMISRELFEYRAQNDAGHQSDFLTVGSMGHASQIALGVAIGQNKHGVCCLDGDGAALMHMGSLAITGQCPDIAFLHIILNNGAHDSVGGQATVALKINFPQIAKSCGYKQVYSVGTPQDLANVLDKIKVKMSGANLIEIKVKKGNRADLGRPTNSPLENKIGFMGFVQ